MNHDFVNDDDALEFAAVALSKWFRSQEIGRAESMLVMYRLITAMIVSNEHSLEKTAQALDAHSKWLLIEAAGFFREDSRRSRIQCCLPLSK